MAYNDKFLAPVGGSLPTVWSYETADTIGEVTTADYFEIAATKLEEGDVVFVRIGDGHSICRVLDDNASVALINLPATGLSTVETDQDKLLRPDGLGGTEWFDHITNKFILGWGFYVQSSGTQTVTTTPSLLEIDAGGGTTETGYLPGEIRGVSQLWDSVNNKILPVSIGDGYTLRIDLEITAEGANPTSLELVLDIGGAASPTIPIVKRLVGLGKTLPYTVSVGFPVFSLTNFVTNGGQIFLSSDTGTVTLASRQISIHRISSDAGN